MKKKGLALILAATLLIVCAVSGTMAWLTAESDTVSNTFTVGNITVTLTETTGREYQMVPGCTIEKNPEVTASATSEDCYLFVKLVKSANFDSFLTYEMAAGWTLVPGETNVYYRTVMTTDAARAFEVLKDNKVTVKDTVTKADMSGLATGVKPTLTVTAYASQFYKSAGVTFSPEEAWAVVNS